VTVEDGAEARSGARVKRPLRAAAELGLPRPDRTVADPCLGFVASSARVRAAAPRCGRTAQPSPVRRVRRPAGQPTPVRWVSPRSRAVVPVEIEVEVCPPRMWIDRDHERGGFRMKRPHESRTSQHPVRSGRGSRARPAATGEGVEAPHHCAPRPSSNGHGRLPSTPGARARLRVAGVWRRGAGPAPWTTTASSGSWGGCGPGSESRARRCRSSTVVTRA